MDYFENVSVNNNAFFVDLFVRASNCLAIQMYEKFGYVTYRRVLGYYSGELPEDALDMRKALPRYECCYDYVFYYYCRETFVATHTFTI
jgi:N-terminal acetyltransferase B complex catalytic subunit